MASVLEGMVTKAKGAHEAWVVKRASGRMRGRHCVVVRLTEAERRATAAAAKRAGIKNATAFAYQFRGCYGRDATGKSKAIEVMRRMAAAKVLPAGKAKPARKRRGGAR